MVDVDRIKTAIVDREEEIEEKFNKEKMIERTSSNDIKDFVGTDAALIITGVRRCGKSTLAFMLKDEVGEEDFGYINFEDERLLIEGKELNKTLEAIYSLKDDVDLLIFDEIQNIEHWEKFISRLLPNKKVVITGSNARLLSKELSTHLTGRHIDFVLFPFSFKEYLKWKDIEPDVYSTKKRSKIKNSFEEYMKKGGFPLTYKIGNIFLSENYRDIINRDILQRYDIKYTKTFKEMARYLITNSANEITYNKLANSFEMGSPHTAKNYVSYLENAYLIFTLNKFSYKLKEQTSSPKKVYCIDTGLIDTIGFRFTEDKGKFLENLVAVELLRRTKNAEELELYYWKDHRGREVDFVVKDSEDVKKLIQVTYASSKDRIKERETKNLLIGSEEFGCDELYVITKDYNDRQEMGDKEIKFTPAWKWLLE